MASRFSAARPNRAGENFARTHHNDDDDGESDSKRVKFDVRNPSTLAPDAREEDSVLDADVIGGSGATKRGAVNLDGYDSDSDNETFNAKAATRKEGKKPDASTDDKDDDDEDDMFAANVDDESTQNETSFGDFDKAGRKNKNVHFLDASQIQGQESESRSGGRVELYDRESSDDESDKELAIQEEGVDEEVGAGGLKRNAPRVEAFNLREEMEEGRFDQDGTYVRKAEDPDAAHDKWLEGLSKKDMRKAAEAHERREEEARKQRIQEDGLLVSDLLKALIIELEKAETPLEALARLAKHQTKPKKVPKWKLNKKNKGADGMHVDSGVAEDPAQTRIKESINAITDAADKLLSRDYEEVYDQERELLIREYARQTGQDWVEPKPAAEGGETSSAVWEFRWTDGRDGGTTQGPFDGATMKAWEEAGYFEQGVEFRRADGGADWTQTATFA
ncbi:GYF domain-containing protein [Hirsutella rhossiliensis]|uniref:GYF domain-containing protein n=1 Tax=Hirsutella rhossiliensis TaxID=111463 RepID=A0A9P8SMN7_9HYPO|nr:GYF domain-containing protein [Hirsutella rhossiliensis]KAH0967055.1 GYF domain-containing protein [Hirsutella rhossiliensis]